MGDFIEDDFLKGEESEIEDEDFMSNEDDFETSNWKRQAISDIDSEEEINGNSDVGCRGPRMKSELELLREKNIKERDAFLAMLKQDPEYADVVTFANKPKQKKVRKYTKANPDPSFQYSGNVSMSLWPFEKRRSSRLQNIPPVFCKEDLIDETEFIKKRKRSEDYDYYDLETVVFRPKRSRMSHNTIRPSIIPVEQVTDDMIENIARRGTIKVYSEAGTSCHQCRQKTKDQKTCCRNLNCVGVRGQFCGTCLENRYGEDVAVALKDPQWKCPVCRDICNCSFCRQKAGKRPTGILAPLAQQNGHKSVKDFLESLKGEGDYAHQDAIWQKLNDPECLLGYSKDLKFAYMARNIKHEIRYFLTLKQLKKFIWKLETELDSVKDLHDEPRSLLGFLNNTNKALMSDGSHCFMGPVYLKQEFDRLILKMQKEVRTAEKGLVEGKEKSRQLQEKQDKEYINQKDVKIPKAGKGFEELQKKGDKEKIRTVIELEALNINKKKIASKVAEETVNKQKVKELKKENEILANENGTNNNSLVLTDIEQDLKIPSKPKQRSELVSDVTNTRQLEQPTSKLTKTDNEYEVEKTPTEKIVLIDAQKDFGLLEKEQDEGSTAEKENRGLE